MALTKIGKEGITGISNSSDANAITIDSSENVAIGSTDPQGFQLQVNTGVAGNIARFTDGVNANAVIKTSGSTTTFGPDTANSLVLQTNSVERVNINTSGLAQFKSSGISAGNQVFQVIDDGATLFQIRAEDGNISFPQSGAGIYLGVTAGTASNLLDDYEEGTWSAELRGATTSATSPVTGTGNYTKIGNQVTVRIYFSNVNTTGASGNAQITGLPFTAPNLQILHVMTYGQDYDDAGGVMGIHMYVENGTTATLIATKDNAAWQTTGITAGTGKYWALTATYLTS